MPADQSSPIGESENAAPSWREKNFLKRLIASLAVIFLLGAMGYFVGYPAFQDFREKRIVRIAKAFVETGDFRSAYLLLDQHLKNSPNNLEARRILAKILEEYGAGHGLAEWETLVKVQPGNAANYIGYITSALRIRQIDRLPEALAALQQLQPTGVDYFRLAAGFALVKGDANALRQAIEALAKVEPTNPTTQFNLAALRLSSPQATDVTTGREVLEKFARGETLRIRATLALIDDAPRRWPKEKNAANLYVLIARQLELGKPPAAVPGKFTRAGANRLPEPGLEMLIEHLENQPGPAPEDVAMLAQWLLKLGRIREALLWLETLPPQTRKSPAALAATAACAVGLEDWPKLEQLILENAWGPVPAEAVRYAFQARLLREQKNDSRAESVWNSAMLAAEHSLPGMRMLHRLVQLWRWPGKEVPVLWTLVRRFPNDNRAWQRLAEQTLIARDTAQIWRIYNAWVQALPANQQAQIERVVIGLLARPQEPTLASQAAELFREHPNNPGCRLAQALALWRGGLASEALIVLDAVQLNPAAEPRVALARGLVLASIGRRMESERMFGLLQTDTLLPEENALIATARGNSR